MGNGTQQGEGTACPPSPERLGCAEALQALYLASSKLRLRVQQYGPKVRLFSEWDEHAAAMKTAETVLHNTGGEARQSVASKAWLSDNQMSGNETV